MSNEAVHLRARAVRVTGQRLPSGSRLFELPYAQRGTTYAPTARRPASDFARRALDFGVAALLLLLLAPLFAFVSVLVRIDSDGPAFFRQQRLGLNGKPFRILKFRTMHVLEDGDDIRQARPDDDRVTRVGRFLRASSLDELPQFVNVLAGDMSLVGPRPHAVAHDRFFGALIANYALRRNVKPGITGWAQIHGLRGATPTVDLMRRRVDYDLWYAQHRSVLLDLEILARTPLEVLRRRNAC